MNLPDALKAAKAAVAKMEKAIGEAEKAQQGLATDPNIGPIIDEASQAANDAWGALKDIGRAIKDL